MAMIIVCTIMLIIPVTCILYVNIDRNNYDHIYDDNDDLTIVIKKLI